LKLIFDRIFTRDTNKMIFRKTFLFILFFFLFTLTAGIYGIIHDQITYSLCPEYYTKYKFPMFGLRYSTYSSERNGAALVGFASTWWMGFVIALLVLPLCLRFKDLKLMVKHIITSMLLILGFAFIIGWFGYFVGRFFPEGNSIVPPVDVSSRLNFIAVAQMHNFSYAGAIAGSVVAIIRLIFHFKATSQLR
jgi:hypothetical protein